MAYDLGYRIDLSPVPIASRHTCICNSVDHLLHIHGRMPEDQCSIRREAQILYHQVCKVWVYILNGMASGCHCMLNIASKLPAQRGDRNHRVVCAFDYECLHMLAVHIPRIRVQKS